MEPKGLKRIWARYLLVLALLAAISLAGTIAFNVWDRVRAIDSAKQDHADWVFSQLEIEYLKLDRALDDARSGDSADIDNLRKRFDLFYSRAEIAESMQVDAKANFKIRDLRTLLDSLTGLIDSEDAYLYNRLAELEGALLQIESMPREIALASIASAAKASEQERSQIVWLIEMLLLIAVIVTVALIIAIVSVSRQATVQKRTSRALQENHVRLASTLRASLDAVVVIDEEGKIKDFNGSAETIFKISQNDAIDQNFIDLLIAPHQKEQQRKNLAHFKETGQTRIAETGRHEFEMVDRENRIFPVEVSVSLARSSDGALFVTYIRDITDKRQKEQEIMQARDDALAAFRERSRFFAMMSHEMRTPLNGVLSAIQLLDDGKLDNEQQSFLDAARTSGEILLGHINDVLAIERSESDTGEYDLQPCDLVVLTSGLIDTMRPLARTSGARLHLDMRGLNNQSVMTDPRALQQILVNIISNAIKFSPDGDITLRASLQPTEDATKILHLDVIDTGCGISAGDIDRIFEDFVSLDTSYERLTGGTGLGLGIVRRLVRRLGGDISCESELGKGAHFMVRLPITIAEDLNAVTLASPDNTYTASEQLRLLVVDDNEINRGLLFAMLERLGHKATLATGGVEAINLAAENEFDGILMDISMPGTNGVQATQAIRGSDGPNTSTPIIAVTAHALASERDNFKAVGMSGYLEKPLNKKALHDALCELSARETTGPQTTRIQPTDNYRATALLNENQINELLDLVGHEKLKERVTTAIHNMKGELPAILVATDPDELSTRVHAMAGMCGILGAERLHLLFVEIEALCKQGDMNAAQKHVTLIPDVWLETSAAWRKTILQ